MRDLSTYRDARHQQQKAAAQTSAEVRRQRVAIREKMKTGEIDPVKLMRGDYAPLEPFLASWKLEFSLKAIHGIGPVARYRVMEACGWSPSRRLGQLTKEEREGFAALIDFVLNGNDPTR